MCVCADIDQTKIERRNCCGNSDILDMAGQAIVGGKVV